MATELDELIAEGELGKEAHDFKKSDLYRFMVGAAEQEILLAQEALETVDPEDKEQVRKLQNEAALGRRFKRWLDELVAKGDAALAAWRQQQESS